MLEPLEEPRQYDYQNTRTHNLAGPRLHSAVGQRRKHRQEQRHGEDNPAAEVVAQVPKLLGWNPVTVSPWPKRADLLPQGN
jgi:hypothetical protein